ncbi:hypothetical protein [Dactylosporangium sp. CA-139066]|uniref:hypothetical protein n=1 Tax=Dactylosporangium sp. CA-139066 TaxID=3239930 RepID=UPI003D8AA156
MSETSPQRRRITAALQAWHTEWAEKWGIDDFPYEGMTVEQWSANIPPEAEADYRRGTDAILSGVPAAPDPASAPPGMAPMPVEPPLARTPAEARLFVDMRLCPRCGARRTAWNSVLEHLGEGMAERYTGDCSNCGEHQEHLFRLPERHLRRPEGVTVFYGGAEPSQLFDAGEWLAMTYPVIDQVKRDLAAGDAAGARLHTELAWVFIDEAMKFLPDGADAVPPTALWTRRGRGEYDADPRRFTRRRLLLLQDMLREDFGAPDWASAEPARPRLARSSPEAHLFLDLQACVCGATRANWTSVVRTLDNGEPASEYTAQCPRCGRERRFIFRLPPEPPASTPEGADFSYGDGPHSELIDPGQWLAESDRLSRSVPMLSAHADAAERERFRFAIGRAAAALTEVARFAPAGADAVPEEACFTEAGRAVYRAEPGRFRLDRLAAVRTSYLQLLQMAQR